MPAADAQHFDHLVDELLSLPGIDEARRQTLRRSYQALRWRDEQLGDTVKQLQQALDVLRLNVKYLLFDVEATKRENHYLRQLVDEVRDEG